MESDNPLPMSALWQPEKDLPLRTMAAEVWLPQYEQELGKL